MARAANDASPGWAWTQRHALASRDARTALDFQARLERSQFLSLAQTERYQMQHLAGLLRHAAARIPFYRERLTALGLQGEREPTLELWRALPPLTRRDVQQHGDALRTADLPAGHGRTFSLRTSGSTGSPVEVLGSELGATWHKALTFRSMLWALDGFAGKLAVIRQLGGGEAGLAGGETLPRWADEVTLPVETGPLVRLSIGRSLPDQAKWLQAERPDILFTYPSNLDGLLREAERGALSLPRIRQVITIGETLGLETRLLAKRQWNATVFDIYSAEETGYIALQCPEGGGYHLQAEAALVEIVDEQGRQSRPGAIGRVLVTPLFNYAMPLLRYEIGDYAEASGPCRCGRGLPLVRRILGRQRNLLVLPDGTRHWPSFGTRRFLDLAPIRQHQFVQTAANAITANLVVERPLSEAEEKRLIGHVVARLPAPFEITLHYVEDIPRSAGGKYEDFLSLVDADHPRTA